MPLTDDPRDSARAAKTVEAMLQSAATDLTAQTSRDVVERYDAVGVNAAERHANRLRPPLGDP